MLPCSSSSSTVQKTKYATPRYHSEQCSSLHWLQVTDFKASQLFHDKVTATTKKISLYQVSLLHAALHLASDFNPIRREDTTSSRTSLMVSKKSWLTKLCPSSRNTPTLVPLKLRGRQHLNKPKRNQTPRSLRIPSQPKRGQALRKPQRPRRRCDRVTYHTRIFHILLYPVYNSKMLGESR